MLGTISMYQLPPLAILASAEPILSPIVILVLCVIAGIGTILLLPSRREGTSRKIGGTVLAAALLILVALVVHATAGADHSGTGLYFWIFSAIAIVGAIRVVTHPIPVYSALYFILVVFASAGLFVLMYAEFMAAALVLIYAGAILITYVFVIMLAASAQAPGSSPIAGLGEYDKVSREPFAACCVGFAMMGILLFVIFDREGQATSQAPAVGTAQVAFVVGDEAVHGSTQALGKYLFESQLVNLELAGLILTVSMVGAIVIARRRVASEDDAFEPSSETINATMTPVNDDPRSIPVYGTTNPKQKAFPEH
jgi:NADH-quinone oxidoreductase subunit J